MSKRLLWKNAWQAITGSFGRFISILLLMAISAFAFIGLKMTGPDMRATATDFYRQHQLADLTVTSNYGLNQQDKKTIDAQKGIDKVEYGYLQDSTVNGSKTALRVLSRTNDISSYQLTKGKMPKNNHEIAISYLLANKYKIGQTITLNQHNNLKNSRFKVVGYVRSSEYLDRNDFGQTTVGTGQLNGYAVLKKSVFNAPNWAIARITYKRATKMNPYSTSYRNYIDQKQDKLQTALDKNRQAKVDEINQDLAVSKQKIAQTEALGVNVQAQATRIKQQEQQIKSLGKPTYTVNDRDANPGYEIYQSNSERVDILANVFPVFLFIIAALVCLTTMTRFVEEERINIGTLRALGYTNHDVSKKFILYSMVSSVSGVLLGAIFGYRLLPHIIFKAYGANSTLTGFKPLFNISWLLVALIVAICCTTLAALWTLKKDLQDYPSQLLLPKPPKSGSRILLEQITPLWKKMSFNYKVTARNIFRYKSRMLMTIIGVAGCTGLLVMGFGIRDSLNGITQKQYGQIIRYDMIALKNSSLTTHQQSQFTDQLASKDVKHHTAIHYQGLTRKLGTDQTEQTINMIVPSDTHKFNEYIRLAKLNGKKLQLSNKGVIISAKLAKLTKTNVGDKIRLKDASGDWKSFKVAGITEMYMGHFLIMNQHVYRHYFNRSYRTNAELITLKNNQTLQSYSQKLMKTGAVKGINQNVNNQRTIDNIMNSLNKVILILIGMATVLAVVVIYNLTNINVEERIRELSTIKVLGFYDWEVTMYIYRETIFLSIIGILVGYLIGDWLHQFIINSLPPVNAMFDPNMYASNFIISALIPIIITMILAFVVFNKIKKVNMLDALKSVD